MYVSVSDAEGQLAELVRRAKEEDDVILTQRGEAAVRLVPVAENPIAAGSLVARRRAVMEEVRASARSVAGMGTDAARSQDFLYDEYGLPK